MIPSSVLRPSSSLGVRLFDISRRSITSDLLPSGNKAFINGRWLKSVSKKTFAVDNPFTKENIAEVTNCGVQDAQIAVQSAHEAFQKIDLTAKQRGAILRRLYELHIQREDDLAKLLTTEQGKPLPEAKGEIQYSASYLDFFSGEARHIHGEVISPPVQGRLHLHTREPIGVVALITPWNFPSAMIVRKLAAAFASGCPVIVKPAEDTPLSALALATLAQEAGIPDGFINILPADRERTAEISKFLCESKDVDCISFTGSTAVGKLLLTQSASTVKRVCLELGGNAPFVVFDSAEVDVAVSGLMASKFRGSGQTCVSANRILVQAGIHDAFVERLTASVASLKIGNGLEAGVNQGPLINDRAVEKVKHLVDDAVAKGANVVTGGSAVEGTTLFQPTILTGITPEMEIASTEIFGPVVAIQKIENEEEGVAKANETPFGLAAYFFSTDLKQIFRVNRRLEAGIIGVNEGAVSCAEAAFGGVKESGMGREGGSQGIDEYTQWKYTCIRTA